VLTAPWHERDAQSLVERFGAPVFTPPPDTAAELVRKMRQIEDLQPLLRLPVSSFCPRTEHRRNALRSRMRFSEARDR
jgi:hypothetical protein